MSAAPRFSMTTAAVDDADAVRDASQLTEAALSCWGHADAEGAADFEQVLRVLGGVSIHVLDPRQIHLATFAVLDAAAAQDSGEQVGDIADPAVVDLVCAVALLGYTFLAPVIMIDHHAKATIRSPHVVSDVDTVRAVSAYFSGRFPV